MRVAQASVVEKFSRRNIHRSLFLLILISPLLLIPGLKTLGVILLLFFVNLVFSFATHPLRKLSVGVELTTVLTVLCALAFGPWWGMISGLFFIIAEYAGTMRISILSVVTVPSVMLIGLITPLFGDVSLPTLGLFVTVIYNLLTFVLCLLIRQRAFGMAVFAVTNIFWNNLLFSLAGNFLG